MQMQIRQRNLLNIQFHLAQTEQGFYLHVLSLELSLSVLLPDKMIR